MFTPTVISLVLANTIVAVGPSSRLVSAFETARRRHSMGVKASEDAGVDALRHQTSSHDRWPVTPGPSIAALADQL